MKKIGSRVGAVMSTSETHWTLNIQYPKPKTIGVGYVSVTDGDAVFFGINHMVLSNMFRVKLDWAGAAGISLSGMEQSGTDRRGRVAYRYQQWFLAYLAEDDE